MIKRRKKATDVEPTLAIGTLVVAYQPQVDLATGRTCGMEALARWHDPKLGILPPTRFLPLVREASMMKWLTANVVTEVLDQLASWKDRGIDACVSVNLDFESAEDTEFPAWLRSELESRALDPSRVKFEITEETMQIEESSIALTTLQAIRNLGVQLSLDDYGKGYSGLVRLRDLPVTEAKIDKSLVSRSASDWRTLRIVRAMVDLAQDLGIEVVAEGIETDMVRLVITGTGCDKGQGYLFGGPMPVEEIEPFLGSRPEPKRAAG